MKIKPSNLFPHVAVETFWLRCWEARHVLCRKATHARFSHEIAAAYQLVNTSSWTQSNRAGMILVNCLGRPCSVRNLRLVNMIADLDSNFRFWMKAGATR